MSIISEYLKYVGDTEPPIIFHRWSILTSIGALLERNVSYGEGHFTYYPNLYVMLMGESGTRKSTAINLAKGVLHEVGYSYFSSEQTSKEKYLLDLAEQHEAFEGDSGDLSTATLFGPSAILETKVTPSFIVAGEFNDFIGNGNIEFMSWLGNLWDWNGPPYTKRFKNSKSVTIPNPTISILAGNTATGFSLAFPSTAIGQGFFSRLILVQSEPSGRRIRKPKLPNTAVVGLLKEIRIKVRGVMTETALGSKLLDAIYDEFTPLDDARFGSYCTRRYAQLVKLCMICAAVRFSREINEEDIILANTILTHAECLMPKALGEFGRAKSSDIAHTILGMIYSAPGLVTLPELWSRLSQDIDNAQQLMDILKKLMASGKIQHTKIEIPTEKGSFIERDGFLPVRRALIEKSAFVDFGLLTAEEREMKL